MKTYAEIRCTSIAFSSPDTIRKHLAREVQGILPESAVNEAIKLQAVVFTNVLLVAVALFCSGLMFDLLRSHSSKRTRKQPMKRDSRRRQNFFRQASLGCAYSACAFTLAAALAITEVSGVFAVGFGCAHTVKAGPVSLALHWTVTILCLLVCVGLTMLRRTRSDIIGDSTPGMHGQDIGGRDYPSSPGYGPMD